MKKEKKTVSERVRELRQHYKLSQGAFASAMGLKSYQAISSVENGHSEPSDETLSSIVAKFGTTRAWLLHGDGEMLPNGMQVAKVDESSTGNPYKDFAIQQLQQRVHDKEEEATNWKEKYNQVWARLEFFMDRLPLGKLKPNEETAYLADAG